jgi:hypothetical protein
MNQLTIPSDPEAYTAALEASNQPLFERVQQIVKRAEGIVVTDRETAEEAGHFVAGCKVLIDQIEHLYNGDIALAHQLHKNLTTKRRKFLEPLTAAKNIAAGKAVAWQQEEERKEKEAAEAKRKEIEDALQTQLQEKAIELEANGQADEAEAVLEKAVNLTISPDAPAFAARPKVAPVAGIRSRMSYTVVVRDMALFRQWAIEAEQFHAYFALNQSALNRKAVRDKESFSVPGCDLIKKRIGS